MNHNTITTDSSGTKSKIDEMIKKHSTIDEALNKLMHEPIVTKDELEEIYKNGVVSETNKCKNSILVKLKKEAEHGNRQVTIASNFYMEYNSDIVYKAIDDLRKDGYKISTVQSPSRLFTVSF